jgi:hypothetical protein
MPFSKQVGQFRDDTFKAGDMEIPDIICDRYKRLASQVSFTGFKAQYHRRRD